MRWREHFGDWIYAVTDTGMRVVASSDRGQSWRDLSGFGSSALSALSALVARVTLVTRRRSRRRPPLQ